MQSNLTFIDDVFRCFFKKFIFILQFKFFYSESKVGRHLIVDKSPAIVGSWFRQNILSKENWKKCIQNIKLLQSSTLKFYNKLKVGINIDRSWNLENKISYFPENLNSKEQYSKIQMTISSKTKRQVLQNSNDNLNDKLSKNSNDNLSEVQMTSSSKSKW